MTGAQEKQGMTSIKLVQSWWVKTTQVPPSSFTSKQDEYCLLTQSLLLSFGSCLSQTRWWILFELHTPHFAQYHNEYLLVSATTVNRKWSSVTNWKNYGDISTVCNWVPHKCMQLKYIHACMPCKNKCYFSKVFGYNNCGTIYLLCNFMNEKKNLCHGS